MSLRPEAPSSSVEWPTLFLLIFCYGTWALGTTLLAAYWLPLGILVTLLTITLHSSLQHEVLHGHPFANRRLNETLVFVPVGLAIPYGRFRDTHLAHHQDECLTDPYDDPETNFVDPEVWARMGALQRGLACINNTLLGRMLLGPVLTVYRCAMGDFRAIIGGDRVILRDWVLHLVGLALVAGWIGWADMPVWAYLLSAYGGLSILKIRTFLEHRAHDLARGRTVIIDGGIVLPFLFLNNNLHAVHHCKPKVAWYRLPALYRTNREEYLRRNAGYRFASYGEVFKRYLFKAKDPVPHPLWPRMQVRSGGGK